MTCFHIYTLLMSTARPVLKQEVLSINSEHNKASSHIQAEFMRRTYSVKILDNERDVVVMLEKVTA